LEEAGSRAGRGREAQPRPGDRTRGAWIGSALLFAGAVALYLPSLRFGFTIDDPLVTHLNRNMPPSTGDFLAPFRTSIYSGTELAPTNAYLYRPVLMASLSINYRLAGNTYDPFFFHAANILLYGLAVVVAFLLLRAMLAGERTGLVAALTATLFLVFPAHLESVCNVKNREEILAFLLGGASWWLLLGMPGGWSSRGAMRMIAAALLFLLALLSERAAAPALHADLGQREGSALDREEGASGLVPRDGDRDGDLPGNASSGAALLAEPVPCEHVLRPG
jgi:hypothetical protein